MSKRFVCEHRGKVFWTDRGYRIVDTGNPKRPIYCLTHMKEIGEMICDLLNKSVGSGDTGNG